MDAKRTFFIVIGYFCLLNSLSAGWQLSAQQAVIPDDREKPQAYHDPLAELTPENRAYSMPYAKPPDRGATPMF
jgi:hypothetical protein